MARNKQATPVAHLQTARKSVTNRASFLRGGGPQNAVAEPKKTKSRKTKKAKDSQSQDLQFFSKNGKRIRVFEEIRRCQRQTISFIPRAAFFRLVKSIATEFSADLKYKVEAIMCLQEAAEAYLTQVFEDTNLLAMHAGRVTIMARDMKLAMRIRGNKNY
ncbi:unnamed protein product [Bursaphelenchus xylophilus]|uniref:(pine wood nematode) hypothetical protein n=1 Tax=Bursaphelenchus xylophilus TaxID=6326 RepID=A0A1I7SS73_BURXY|nr:unnamed protein product [Bursaphelenchus xylophilus]CAG9105562.1 unnamed protein product [Bursaphelenchus xylophilus]